MTEYVFHVCMYSFYNIYKHAFIYIYYSVYLFLFVSQGKDFSSRQLRF